MYAKKKEIWRQGHLGNLDLKRFMFKNTLPLIKIYSYTGF